MSRELHASDPLISDIDRRVIRLETAFGRLEKTLSRMEDALEDALAPSPTPWGHIFAGLGVAASVIGSLGFALWSVSTSDIERLDRSVTAMASDIVHIRREEAADRWTASDQKAYDKDMTEWQRRQDDEILALWKAVYHTQEIAHDDVARLGK